MQRRPLKQLVKADAEKREAFVAEYAALRTQAKADGAKVFFVDEAHFRADVEVRQMWVPKGQARLIDSTSPSLGEKATYYSAVCLETGTVEAMAVESTCTAETTVAFLKQLRAHHTDPLVVIWDNGPAHRGQEIRDYLTTPDLNLRLVTLPAYSPDFNADEAAWDWVREEATANICFGTAQAVRQRVDRFLKSLAQRTDETMRRCRTRLQARADRLMAQTSPWCSSHDGITLGTRDGRLMTGTLSPGKGPFISRDSAVMASVTARGISEHRTTII